MIYSKETNREAQKTYHEARAFGHTKEEARSLRDNLKTPKPSKSTQNVDVDDDIIWTPCESYDQDCIDD